MTRENELLTKNPREINSAMTKWKEALARASFQLLAKNPREITEAEWKKAEMLAGLHFDEFARVLDENIAKYEAFDEKGPWTVGDVNVSRDGCSREAFVVTGESVNEKTQEVAEKVKDVVIGLVAEKTGIGKECFRVVSIKACDLSCNVSYWWVVHLTPQAPDEEYSMYIKLKTFAKEANYLVPGGPHGGYYRFSGDYARPPARVLKKTGMIIARLIVIGFYIWCILLEVFYWCGW